MEPLMPIVLLEICRIILSLSDMILDMPKSNSGTHVFCKKDVAWFEITVDDWWLAVIMKIIQSIHDINSDIEPLCEAESIVQSGHARFYMEPTIQATIWHELKNQCLEILTLFIDA